MSDRKQAISALRGQIAALERASAPRERESAQQTEGDAFSRIVRLCSVRDRAVSELRERLSKEGFDPKDSEAAIDRACACGLVDDMRFADSFVRGRIARGKGTRGVERELAQRGIDASLLPGWPERFFSEDESELDRARDVLRKSPPRSKNVREGAYRKLIGKGFSSDVAARAAREWAEDSPVL